MKKGTIQAQICKIFYDNPTVSYSHADIKNMKLFNVNSLKTALHRLSKEGILSKELVGDKNRYKLNDVHLAKKLLTKKCKVERREYLGASKIIKKDHHKIYQVSLKKTEWESTKKFFSMPKDNNDRGRQRILATDSFKMVISEKTLKGALYVLREDWKAELTEYYPDLVQQLENKLAHIGVSIDADMWANYILSNEDMKLVFANSHFWKELDVEGSELAINSFLQNILRSGIQKTTYESIIARKLKELEDTIDSDQKNTAELMSNLVEIMQKIDEKLNKLIEG